MKVNYNRTVTACFVAYIVQAIVNNFIPLLFLHFQNFYGVPLSQITMLVTFNFGIQLTVDLVAIRFVDRIGYRISMILAHVFSALGLVLLTVLPEIMPTAFGGILLSVAVYAIGGGLLEVLVSPVVEACPSDNKEKAMSMLHSFYCWGHVGVVLLSTLFFKLFGIGSWKIMALVWAMVPAANGIVFTRVPMAPLLKDGQRGMKLRELLGSKLFWLLFVMMVCSGASEQAVSQWSSAFAEKGLGISKTAGDLMGPMAFAVCMGLARAFYGKVGDRIPLDRFMIFSCLLCVGAYLGTALFPVPLLSLLACAVCGLSVGIMWPGTFSKAAAVMPLGGTAMFALLALGGDLGCSGGPTLVGFVASSLGDNLKLGILAGILFPVLLLGGIFLTGRFVKKGNGGKGVEA